MKNRGKKGVTVLLALSLCATLGVTVATGASNKDAGGIGTIRGDDGPSTIIEATVVSNKTELAQEMENQEKEPRIAKLYAGVIRDGSSEDCELYLYWMGTSRYDGWRFKEVVLSNGSSVNYKEYDSIGDGSEYNTYEVDSSSFSEVKLGDVTIPESVSRVKIEFDSLEGSLSANRDGIPAITTANWATIS